MLLPLYCHYSARDWKTLLTKKDLHGVTVILNPNDGPKVAKAEAAAWSTLALKLAAKGADIAVYIDTCTATYVNVVKPRTSNKKWDLVPKSPKDILGEWALYTRLLTVGTGNSIIRAVFMDDFADKRMRPNAQACDVSHAALSRHVKVIVNPGTVADKAWKAGFPDSTVWLEHEQDGFPKDTSQPFVALGVKSVPDNIRIGRYSYAHSASDGKNPYESLSPFFDELLTLEHGR